MTSPVIAQCPEIANPARIYFRRLLAMVQRHVFLYLGSWPRFIETLFWPMLNMLMYGFVSVYMLHQFTNATIVASALIAGTMLNECMLRTIIGTMLMFLEEIWSRNLGHLFVSPLKLSNYVTASMFFTFVKSIVSIAPVTLVAMALFKFSIFSIGWPLAIYVVLLIMSGWWYGMLMISLLLRFGIAAEWMAWMSAHLLIPIVAPYYPVDVLPSWLQAVSWCLPPTYVYESAKSVLAGGPLRVDHLVHALLLNLVYFAVAAFILRCAFNGARRRGGLLQVGE